jgi:hypothetical protein
MRPGKLVKPARWSYSPSSSFKTKLREPGLTVDWRRRDTPREVQLQARERRAAGAAAMAAQRAFQQQLRRLAVHADAARVAQLLQHSRRRHEEGAAEGVPVLLVLHGRAQQVLADHLCEQGKGKGSEPGKIVRSGTGRPQANTVNNTTLPTAQASV